MANRPALEQEPIPIHPTEWRQAVGKSWPWADHTTEVSRPDVFAIAGDVHAGLTSPDRLLVAACAWGFGSKARYGPWRTQRMLATPGAVAKLDRLIGQIATDLKGAYQSMWPNADNHLDKMGPAFWTKLFYFAGYEQPGEPKPLILDANVARGLRRATGNPWPTGGWSSTQYLAYLTYASDQAEQRRVEPDDIELELFNKGRG